MDQASVQRFENGLQERPRKGHEQTVQKEVAQVTLSVVPQRVSQEYTKTRRSAGAHRHGRGSGFPLADQWYQSFS